MESGRERRVLVVCGLAHEARIASGPGVTAICGGAERLAAVLRGQSAAAIGAVVSFGIAGGLEPSLRTGDVVLGARIIRGGGEWRSSPPLLAALTDKLTTAGVRQITIISVDTPALTPGAKAALRAATGADAVDMESHLAAAYADVHGLPFCSLRVVSDPAERALPPLASHALTADGRTDLAAVLAGVARQPGQIGALIQAGRDAAAAFAALRRCRRLLGVGFGVAHL